MEPIFDRTGRTVGWLEDSVVFDMRPRHRAFIDAGAVFAYNRRYVGTLDNGFFRDRSGHAVAFMEGATRGPIPPVAAVPPVTPVPPVPPVAPVPPVPPVPPVGQLSWSAMSWEDFLRG